MYPFYTVYHFVNSDNLKVKISLKKGAPKKFALKYRLRHRWTLDFHFLNFYAKHICFFYWFFFGILKRITSKRSIFLIPRLLNSFILPRYGSNSRKRYALKLLPMCLKEEFSNILLWNLHKLKLVFKIILAEMFKAVN